MGASDFSGGTSGDERPSMVPAGLRDVSVLLATGGGPLIRCRSTSKKVLTFRGSNLQGLQELPHEALAVGANDRLNEDVGRHGSPCHRCQEALLWPKHQGDAVFVVSHGVHRAPLLALQTAGVPTRGWAQRREMNPCNGNEPSSASGTLALFSTTPGPRSRGARMIR